MHLAKFLQIVRKGARRVNWSLHMGHGEKEDTEVKLENENDL